MIANGEILQLCERGTHWVAKVALKVGGIYELVNVELKAGEVENGRLASGIRERVVNRALTQIA